MLLTNIENWQRTFISGYDMYVLRNKKTNVAINVSYTREGLQWTTDQYGNFIYFKNPRIFKSVDENGIPKITLLGDRINPDFYVEKFVPRDHIDQKGRFITKNQLAEYFVTAKALRLLTPMNSVDNTLSEVRNLNN